MRSLIKTGSLYGIAEIIKKVSPFLLLPVFVHSLSPEDFGRLEYITIICTLLSLLVCFGSGSGLLRLYMEKDGNEFVFISLMVSVIITALLSLIFYLIPVYELIGLSSNSILYFCLLYSWFFSIVNVGVVILRAEEKIKAYVFLNLFIVFAQLISIVISLKLLELSFESKVVGNVLSYGGISILVAVLVIRYRIEVCWNNVLFMKMLKFHFPIVGGGVSGWFNGSIDKVVILNILGEAALGLYSLVVQLVQVFKLSIESFLKAFTVQYYRDKELRTIVSGSELLILLTMSGIGAGFLLICNFIVLRWVPVEYVVPSSFLVIALSSRVVMLLNFVETIKVYYQVKSLSVLLINILGGLVNAAALYILVPETGLIGAFVSFFIAVSVMYLAYSSGLRAILDRIFYVLCIAAISFGFSWML